MFKARYLGALCVLACLVGAIRAADDKPADSKSAPSASPAATSPAAATSTDKAEKTKGRLPSGYSKLGITTTQRQKIYDIQSSYKSQLDALQKQLSDLEAKRDAEVFNVLTDDQKKQFTDANSGSTKKSSKKAAAADAKTAAATN